MSNLSELLPTGGGQNAVDFVATGTLSSGQTVVLKTDGTVEAVAETATPAIAIPQGSAAAFNVGTTEFMAIAYNPSVAGQFVVVYRDVSNSNYFTANLGTVSGTSITFGSDVIILSSDCVYAQVSFDPNTANKFVVACANQSNSNQGTVFVGTVSGSTLSFGSAQIFNSGNTSIIYGVAYDPNVANKFVVAYYDGANSNYGTAIVGTVSGTSISYGSASVFSSSYSYGWGSPSFDPNTSSKFVISFRDAATSPAYGGAAIVGTISGTSLSFGTKATFTTSGTTNNVVSSYDPNTANKFVAVYKDAGTGYGTAIVGTVSGTSITYGSAVTINAESSMVVLNFDPSVANQFVVAYGTSAKIGTVSGTSVSFSSAYTFASNAVATSQGKIGISFDDAADDGRFVIEYGTAAGASSILCDLTGTTNTTNSADFIGITAEAISDTATGAVNVYGGINEAQTGLTIGSDYYVQADGSLSTATSTVKAGQAISATTINMMDLT